MARSRVSRLWANVATAVDHRRGLRRWPTPLSLQLLVGIRQRLRDQNLPSATASHGPTAWPPAFGPC